MAADHDDFVFQLRVRAENLGDGVEAVLVVAGEFRIDIEFDADGNARFQEAVNAAVVFDGGDGDGQGVCVFTLIDEPAEAGASVVEDGAARAAAVSAVAAGGDHGDGFFVGEKV